MAFIGRDKQLSALERFLADKSTRVIYIHGESGIGKTALANQARVLPVCGKFSLQIRRLAYRSGADLRTKENAMHLLIASIVYELRPGIERNIDFESQLQLLFKYISKHKTLIVLDNVESLGNDTIYSFVEQWLKVPSHSKLLLTTIKKAPFEKIAEKKGMARKTKPLHLKGLLRNDAVKLLMGQFSKDYLYANPKVRTSVPLRVE